MKLLLLVLLFSLLNCAGLKKKDFIRSEEVKVESVKKDFAVKESVLNKFITKNKPTPTKKAKTTKKVAKKIAKVTKLEKTKPISKSRYPKDYPSKLRALDKGSEQYINKFQPRVFVGEKIYIDITYLGINAGQIVVETQPNVDVGGVDAHHFYARLKSAPFYKYIYELDDTLDSFVSSKSFTPIKYSLLQRESGKNIDDIQLYDREKLKTFTFYKKENLKKKQKIKKENKEAYIPRYFQDALSILHYLRGLPLKVSDTYRIPVVNKAKILILDTKVLKKETISTDLGKKKAIKINVKTGYTGETIKSGDMTFWFSDDERRILLRIKAKIKLGSVVAETVKYEQ